MVDCGTSGCSDTIYLFLSFPLKYFVPSFCLCFRVTRLHDCNLLMLSESCLSIPQFGSSFATFRPALSHTGSIRPFSVILPASPPYSRSPGSNTSSPTSKVPCWKVCSHGHNFFADFFSFAYTFAFNSLVLNDAYF